MEASVHRGQVLFKSTYSGCVAASWVTLRAAGPGPVAIGLGAWRHRRRTLLSSKSQSRLGRWLVWFVTVPESTSQRARL